MGQKKRGGCIEAKDVAFCTLIHDDIGLVVAEQDVVMIQTQSDRQMRNPPDGINLLPEHYGKKFDLIVRDATDEIILDAGADDCREEDLTEKSRRLAITSTQDLEELFQERKVQSFTKSAASISTAVAGLVLAIAGAWLYGHEFFIPYLALACVPAGVALGLLFGVLPLWQLIRRLNCDIIVDCNGRWVNMKTGRSNINGGMRFPTGRS